MKKILFSLMLIMLCINAYGQFRMVGVGPWSTVNDTTYNATVTFDADLTGNNFFANQIVADSFMLFSGTEQLYKITDVTNPLFYEATLTVVEVSNNYTTTDGPPLGKIMTYDPGSLKRIPQVPFGTNGSTAQLQAAVDTYNSKIADDGGLYAGSGATPDEPVIVQNTAGITFADPLNPDSNIDIYNNDNNPVPTPSGAQMNQGIIINDDIEAQSYYVGSNDLPGLSIESEGSILLYQNTLEITDDSNNSVQFDGGSGFQYFNFPNYDNLTTNSLPPLSVVQQQISDSLFAVQRNGIYDDRNEGLSTGVKNISIGADTLIFNNAQAFDIKANAQFGGNFFTEIHLASGNTGADRSYIRTAVVPNNQWGGLLFNPTGLSTSIGLFDASNNFLGGFTGSAMQTWRQSSTAPIKEGLRYVGFGGNDANGDGADYSELVGNSLSPKLLVEQIASDTLHAYLNDPANNGYVATWDSINNRIAWVMQVTTPVDSVVFSNDFAGDGTIADPITLADKGATNDQVLGWNGTSWQPKDDLDGVYQRNDQITEHRQVLLDNGNTSFWVGTTLAFPGYPDDGNSFGVISNPADDLLGLYARNSYISTNYDDEHWDIVASNSDNTRESNIYVGDSYLQLINRSDNSLPNVESVVTYEDVGFSNVIRDTRFSSNFYSIYLNKDTALNSNTNIAGDSVIYFGVKSDFIGTEGIEKHLIKGKMHTTQHDQNELEFFGSYDMANAIPGPNQVMMWSTPSTPSFVDISTLGNSIYVGDGNVPTGTTATLSDSLTFTSGSSRTVVHSGFSNVFTQQGNLYDNIGMTHPFNGSAYLRAGIRGVDGVAIIEGNGLVMSGAQLEFKNFSSNTGATMGANALTYDQNYGARYTDRSLVDKRYVDSLLSSKEDIWLLPELKDNDVRIDSANTLQLINAGGAAIQDTILSLVSGYNSDDGFTNLIHFKAGSHELGIEAFDGHMALESSSAGWEYAANYHSSYTDRSLVDKEYVDDAVAGGGSTWMATELPAGNVEINGGNNHLYLYARRAILGDNTNTINVNTTNSAILSGQAHEIEFGANNSFILGGISGTIQSGSVYAGLGAGQGNEANDDYSSVWSGFFNRANARYSSITSGDLNTADGDYSYIPYGRSNHAVADSSEAHGSYGRSYVDGSSTYGGGRWSADATTSKGMVQEQRFFKKREVGGNGVNQNWLIGSFVLDTMRKSYVIELLAIMTITDVGNGTFNTGDKLAEKLSIMIDSNGTTATLVDTENGIYILQNGAFVNADFSVQVSGNTVELYANPGDSIGTVIDPTNFNASYHVRMIENSY